MCAAKGISVHLILEEVVLFKSNFLERMLDMFFLTGFLIAIMQIHRTFVDICLSRSSEML